jgi:hypothetical protein
VVEDVLVGSIETRLTAAVADLYGDGLTLTDGESGATFTIRFTGWRLSDG